MAAGADQPGTRRRHGRSRAGCAGGPVRSRRGEFRSDPRGLLEIGRAGSGTTAADFEIPRDTLFAGFGLACGGNLAASELQTVTRAIAKFADDKDRGIQQLRQSLERETGRACCPERTIQARQKTVAAARTAAALEQTRGQTAGAWANRLRSFLTITQVKCEGAWADYYEKLAQAIQVANAPAAAAYTSTTGTNRDPERYNPRVPLVRYVGAWTYPIGQWPGPRSPARIGSNWRFAKRTDMRRHLLGRFKPRPGGRNDPDGAVHIRG